MELYSFLLSDWRWKHVLEMDKKIAPYIRQDQSALKHSSH